MHSDVVSNEHNDSEFTEQAAGDAVVILIDKVAVREIRADDGRLTAILTGVDDVLFMIIKFRENK